MGNEKRHLIILLTLVVCFLMWGSNALAAYPSAPTLPTSGSAAYRTIAGAINGWKNAWTAGTNNSNNTNDAWTHRSAIIDQVEATLLAAGKGTITDAEYDDLADALYFWLHQVADEGAKAENNGGHYNNQSGWYISGIGIPEHFFSHPNYGTINCVWELTNATVGIGGTGANGYGPMLGPNTRMVLITNLEESTIVRSHARCNVMFSTNGVNSKLLILGRKNHRIALKGSQGWSEPASYNDVLNRTVSTADGRGQEVVVNGGSLMTAYTTFHQNISTSSKCRYHVFTNANNVPPADTTKLVTYSEGGAIGVTGAMNCCSFYYTTIKNNSTSENSRFGGGIGFTGVKAKTAGTDGNVYFNHCTIKGNRNGSHGGGLAFYYNTAADGRNVYLKNTEISYNCQKSFDASGAQIEAHGGGLWVVNAYDSDISKQRKVYFDGCTFTGNYSTGKTAAGGAISNEGTIELTGCAFNNNVADNSFGGAIYNRPQMADGNEKGVDLTLKGCSFTGNQCTWTGDLDIDDNDPISNPTRGSGGAIMIDIYRKNSYAVSESYVVKLDIEDNCTFTNNHADRSGGAIAVAACRDMESWLDNPPTGHGTLTSNMEIKSATMSGNTAGKNVTWPSGRGNYGGAIYLSYTNLNVTGNNSNVQIKNNGNVGSHTATQYGGAVAIYKGDLTLSGGTFGASGNGNKATYGGAFYINQGTVNLNGGLIDYNTATEQGGGLYATGNGSITVNGVTMSNNTAKSGGGIFTNNSAATNFNMSNGTISGNSATNGNGGGVCLDANTTLNLSGSGSVTGNSATNGQGGGIYMGGAMTVDGSSLTVTGNTVNSSSNNVYLPSGKMITAGSSLNPNVNMGIFTQNEATVGNPIPVFTGTSAKLSELYTAMHGGASMIRDDRRLHLPYYPASPGDILYFALVEFDDGPYSEDFSGDINTWQKLYQFMCWVNGVNGYTTTHPNASGNVTADIDMTAVTKMWIPIGENNVIGSTLPYTGVFSGNGHVISGLTMTKSNYLYANYGLFGSTEEATIQDLFVTGCNFVKSGAGTVGCIVGKMNGGALKNSGGSGAITATSDDCIIGGLVGQTTGGTIHSSFATATMTGYQMGGLVGQMATGTNLYNSFANGRFTAQTGSDKYMGGLVGVNAGRIENCYARIQNASNPSSTYFGWIAGQNNSGTITYCYIPTTDYSATYVKNGTAADNKCTSFGPTVTPYQYKHADNQMTANANNTNIVNGAFDRNGLKGLLATLNKWVGSSATYAKWMRTSASPINGDYPLHDYTGYVCVGSKDNVTLEYSADFNTKFKDYITANSGTIYLYQSPTAAVTPTLSNSGGVPALYIHEDVVMMHTSTIKAHVGITLDNSAGTAGANPSFAGQGYTDNIDWHFFSSALKDSPIGLHYGAAGETEDTEQYQAYVYPSWNATFTNANGYFPLNLNDYYADWDLYAYCEPDYHWINLKRNSASHWHEDYPGINIPYNNDTEFVPGKGYMVALKEEGYLQAYGTLNSNTGEGSDYISVPVTCTSSIGWTTREGHNLLGNPYQSYLDFDAFVRKNESLWKEGRDPFYIIMDEDNKDYVLYTVGQSPNAEQASRFLHPHQGFMIDSNFSGTAKFDNGMRTTSTTTTGDSPVTWEGHFRGEETPCYPLVNLMATDGDGNRDIVTVELGRPDKGGALKQDAMHSGKGSLWCRYEDEDYALVFTQPGLDAANIRFASDEDAEFTMTWSTHNGEFSYLHLIDNLTGADIDCLTASEYRFSAHESDYNSRFRLVFDYTGIDDHEVPEPVEGPATFAYYANGEIHLMATPDATAQLQIIDMTGRTIVSRDGVHTVSTTGLAAGVYVLRLTDGNGTRTQKIILN